MTKEELEKENLYYKDVIETNTAEWEEQGQRVVTLEKENAELKKWKEDTIKARGNDYMAWSRQNDQLTTAKNLLKKWIEPKYDREELLYLTEQFLNSEVENDSKDKDDNC